jgi:hypothetical protein
MGGFEDESDADEERCSGVGPDHRSGVDHQAVDEPENDACEIKEEHRVRKIASALPANLDDLRDEGGGGADGGDGADEIDEWHLCLIMAEGFVFASGFGGLSSAEWQVSHLRRSGLFRHGFPHPAGWG